MRRAAPVGMTGTPAPHAASSTSPRIVGHVLTVAHPPPTQEGAQGSVSDPGGALLLRFDEVFEVLQRVLRFALVSSLDVQPVNDLAQDPAGQVVVDGEVHPRPV